MSVEHAAVSLGLLLEHGGRHPALNRELTDKISSAAHQLMESLGQKDQADIWTYGDVVNVLADFNVDRQTEDRMLLSLSPPDVSEANLYDALIFAIGRMCRAPERKAIVVISSGVDTFSKAAYEDVLTAARKSDAPLYAVSLGQILEEAEVAWLGPQRDRLEPVHEETCGNRTIVRWTHLLSGHRRQLIVYIRRHPGESQSTLRGQLPIVEQ